MEIEDWAVSSGGSSDSEVTSPESDNEDHCYAYGDIPKLQFRKDGSKARWKEELGMAEFISNKGRMWTTTGIVRGGKIYSFFEDTLFLAEIGALQLLDDEDQCISLEDIYKKVAEGVGGSSWESFEVYRHLKSLGYIIKRHGICWSMKPAKSDLASPESESENGYKDESPITEITELFSTMRINEVKPVFDVYPPNSKFRKSSPGKPLFNLSISSGNPPTRKQIEDLEEHCEGVPLKFCYIEHGRVSFFSFNKIEDWAVSSGGSSDSEVTSPESDNEDHCYAYGDIPKLQFRKDGSKARWKEELGMAEIVSNKGRMWTTTGIVRGGKIYIFLEDTLFLVEIGALQLLDDEDQCISLEDIYNKVAKGVGGSSRESFVVYRHLKSLGYIIKRHGVCWSVKRAKSDPASPESEPENGYKDESPITEITELFSTMRINEVKPVFDVYPPNSKFRKSSPGKPLFILSISSGNPPTRKQIEDLEEHCEGVPLKFCYIEHGRVSFFSFNKIELPVLP